MENDGGKTSQVYQGGKGVAGDSIRGSGDTRVCELASTSTPSSKQTCFDLVLRPLQLWGWRGLIAV